MSDWSRFPMGKPGSRRWFVSQQVVLAVLMILNGWMLWQNWEKSVDFDVLLHGAKHLYDFAADRCMGRPI